MNGFSRTLRWTLLVMLALAACQPAVTWPAEGWPATTPESQGIDSAKLADALLTMRERGIMIHSLLVIRDGKALVDAYFYPYDGGTVHDLASVTKSVMTTLIAIAAEQGKLDLDAPMVSFFPERTIANLDAAKKKITVRHLASMSSGLDSVGFEQDEGTLMEMVDSANYVQFALDRKVTFEPGTHFSYDSPGMHLLSAILQEATGMTAQEFAQENLFGPLGITEVNWRADPQGYSHGWGDLYLHPHDAAKIGYLWLHGGMWDGKRIVSEKWVEASHQRLMDVGEDKYGYGWWVDSESDSYWAAGRGGQYIRVEPSVDALVIATGGGFDYEEIEPLLISTLVDPENPLPENPEGMKKLEDALVSIAQPPAATEVAALPEIAATISGNIYVFEPNPLGIDALRIEFDDSDEARLYLTLAGNEEPQLWPIGLDGVFRMSPSDFGLPQGARGSWTEEGTFVMEVDSAANNDHAFYTIRFEDGRLLIGGQETAHELGTEVEGRLQEP